MPDFRIGAQVSGLENLRAMAREVLNVNRAFQSAGRQKLAAPAVNISKMTAGLATAAVPVEDFQRRLNRIFATGLVPRGTAEQVRAQTGQIVQSLLQLGNKEAADRVRDLGARLASELDRISTDVEQNAQRMARGLVSMTRGTLTGAGGIVQPLRDMAASVAEEAARLKQSLVPIRTFERELARISAGGQVSPRLAERVNAMVANVQQSLRELGRPDLASAASDLGRNIVRGLERVSPQLMRQSVEIRDSLEEIVDALKQVPADPAIIESLERVRAGLGGFRIDTRAINADAVRKSIESLAQPGETLDAVYRTVSRSIQVLGGELQRLRDEQDAAATAGRQLTDEDRRNVSVLEDQIKSLLSAHQALAPYVNTLSSAEKILRGFNREGRVSSSQISGLGNLARLAEDQFAGVSGEIEQVTADVDLLGNRVERFNRAGTRAFAALRPEVTALRDLLQQVPASISMPEAPQSAQMADDIAQQLSRIEQSGSVTQGSLEKLSLSLRNLAGVEPELAPALESIASNFDTMAQKLASVSTEVSRRSLPAMQSMGSELAKTAQEAMAAVAPLTQLDNTFKRISRSGRDISSEAVESLRAQAQGLAQERGLPAGVRASLAAQVPILTDTSDLLEAQKNRLREVQMAHRGFASHTGTSAQALLFLQSATQGVMTALALLRGNLMFAGFGLIFMRFTVVRVMLAFTALTFVLGGVMKLWTGFIAGAKGAGAAMQVLRFQIMRQLGSAREVGAFFRAAEVLVRRFGFALDDTTSGLTKMQREGLGPLLANRDLVADFARTFSLSFEQATDTLTNAIGRQRGSLESLGDTMGVIPEIFNKNLDKLNEASRSERAEFVINLLQRYKGAAEDYARTLPGALNRVREAFNGFVRDVTEPFARNVLAPAMNGLANLLNTVSLLVRGLKASEPAQRLWNKFLTNMRTAMQLLVPDTEKFGKTIGVLVVGSLLLALKLAVLLSAALVKLAAFIHLAAGAFRRFLQLIKPVIDQLRALAQMLKSLNLGGQFAKLKNFAVDLADGLLSLGKPSHLAVIGLHAVTLAFADFVKGFVGAGGSALGRRIGRALNPAARAIGTFTDDMARMFGTSADEVAESGLRRWAAAAGRLGKGVVRFFTKDFTDPLGDMLRLRVISKIAKEESDTLIETILKSMTAPGRLAMAPITTPFRILGSSLKAGLMLVIRDIPTMLRAV